MPRSDEEAWKVALGRDPLLTPTARFVLVYLGHRAKDGRVESRPQDIARALALSTRTVHQALTELVSKGVIGRTALGRPGRWREYQLLSEVAA